MATVNSLAVELITEIGESTDDSGFVSSVETYVNNALDEIALATEWNQFRARVTVPTVASQSQYTLPAGGREIIQITHNDTGEPIHIYTVEEAARRSIRLDLTGRPVLWLEDGNVVSGSDVLYRYRLTPVPNAVFSLAVQYFYHPSNVASGSVLPVQDQFIVPVKDRVRSFLLERDGKYDAADRAQRRFEKWLETLVKHETNKHAGMPRLQPSDLVGKTRRQEPIFDPAHYANSRRF